MAKKNYNAIYYLDILYQAKSLDLGDETKCKLYEYLEDFERRANLKNDTP